MVLFPRKILLKITCTFVVICWFLLFIFLIGLLLHNFGFEFNLFSILWKYLLIGCLLFALAYIIMAFFFHCPHCDKRFLIQTNEEKHRNAQKIRILNYWSTTIMNIVLNNKFTCMYCGNSYRTK